VLIGLAENDPEAQDLISAFTHPLNRLVPHDLSEDRDAVASGIFERYPHAVILGGRVEAAVEKLVEPFRIGHREGE